MLFYNIEMRCRICNQEFIPAKYHPHQQVCSKLECQHRRQLQNQRDWRIRNPGYFRHRGQDFAWQKSRRRYMQQWRVMHKDYIRDYQISHRPKRREYMREYMRKYREIQVKKSISVRRNKS